MKNIKKIMCNGLAFGDKEDMEMLHQYALEGWIFKEFKGVFYILHKEEPQDLIFSYDFGRIGKNDESDYYEFFRSAGWKPIKCSDKTTRFFYANNGTVPVHTDVSIQANQFKKTAIWSFVTFVASALLLFAALRFNETTWMRVTLKIVAGGLLGGIMGASGMCFVGCFLRTIKKRLAFSFSMKTNIILLIACIITFVTIYLLPHDLKQPLRGLFAILSGISLGGSLGLIFFLIYKYPLYRDGKVK